MGSRGKGQGVGMITRNQAIDAIQEYCEFFSGNVPNHTKDRWVKRLCELNISRPILAAAVKRCADNDLGANWSRLRASIAVERSIEASKRFDRSTGDSQAFEDWVQAYRAEGLSSGHPPPPGEARGRTTEPEVAQVCLGVISDILAGRTRCPREFAHHDIHATGDKEEEWFWGRVSDKCKES